MCKVFVTGSIFWIGQVCLHSTPLECEKGRVFFYSHCEAILLRWSKEVFTDKDFFTPEAWYVYRNSNAKVPALQRSAMCVGARFIGVKSSLWWNAAKIFTHPQIFCWTPQAGRFGFAAYTPKCDLHSNPTGYIPETPIWKKKAWQQAQTTPI